MLLTPKDGSYICGWLGYWAGWWLSWCLGNILDQPLPVVLGILAPLGGLLGDCLLAALMTRSLGRRFLSLGAAALLAVQVREMFLSNSPTWLDNFIKSLLKMDPRFVYSVLCCPACLLLSQLMLKSGAMFSWRCQNTNLNKDLTCGVGTILCGLFAYIASTLSKNKADIAKHFEIDNSMYIAWFFGWLLLVSMIHINQNL